MLNLSEPSDDAYRTLEQVATAWGAATSEDEADRAAARIIEAYGDRRVAKATGAA